MSRHPDPALVLDLLVDLVADRLEERQTQQAAVEPWLTLEQAESHTGISAKTMSGWIRDGLLGAGGAGKLTRVKRSDIDACMRRIAADDLQRRREPVSLRTAEAVARLRKAG